VTRAEWQVSTPSAAVAYSSLHSAHQLTHARLPRSIVWLSTSASSFILYSRLTCKIHRPVYQPAEGPGRLSRACGSSARVQAEPVISLFINFEFSTDESRTSICRALLLASASGSLVPFSALGTPCKSNHARDSVDDMPCHAIARVAS
jgi:hypothetical protein